MKTLLPYIDPLGHAVNDYFTTGESTNILVESDIAEVSVIKSSYLFRDIQEMPVLEKKALELCRGKILDIGAGAGCHSVVLQNNGMDITALDYSEYCCEVMTKRGIKQVILGNYFDHEGSAYDTLLFLMNGIGLAGSLDEMPKFLKKASGLLKDGGQLLFDSSDVEYMYYEEDGTKLINLNSRYYGELLFRMVYNTIEGEPFPWLYIDYQTLARIAPKLGFEPELILQGDHHSYLARLLKKA